MQFKMSSKSNVLLHWEVLRLDDNMIFFELQVLIIFFITFYFEWGQVQEKTLGEK